MDQEKIIDVLKNKTFAKKISKFQTPEEIQSAFKEKGIEISLEEVQLLGSVINKMIEKRTTELSKEDLEDITGGVLKDLWTGAGMGITPPLAALHGIVVGENELFNNRSQALGGLAGSILVIVEPAAIAYVIYYGFRYGWNTPFRLGGPTSINEKKPTVQKS